MNQFPVIPIKSEDLPPLWDRPAPPRPGPGHNGGPASTPGHGGPTQEVRQTLLDALGDGAPLQAISAAPGMPDEDEVHRWRASDAEFDRMFRLYQQFGWEHLTEAVFEETERNIEEHGWQVAERVFSIRRDQLARQAPEFFG